FCFLRKDCQTWKMIALQHGLTSTTASFAQWWSPTNRCPRMQSFVDYGMLCLRLSKNTSAPTKQVQIGLSSFWSAASRTAMSVVVGCLHTIEANLHQCKKWQ